MARSSDGRMSTAFPGLRLIIRKFDAYARYVIVKRAGYGGSCDEVMLSSGTEPNVSCNDGRDKAARRIDLIVVRAPQADDSLIGLDFGRRDKWLTVSTS